jgi:hypothetical protein
MFRGGSDANFMRAVGFALSGSDYAEVKAIDRANCVFAYQSDVFYLNNVQADRITIQDWEIKPGMKWINVGLHGDDVVVENTTEPITDKNAKLFGRKEYELRLLMGEVNRVKRAWQYIYSHECVGKKSPFLKSRLAQ